MFNLRATTAVAIALTLASCSSTPESEPESKSYRDPYRDQAKPYERTKPLYRMSKAEKKEYWEDFYEGKVDERTTALCIFGSNSALDRKKMGCEKVVDSPEWEALQEKKAEAQRAADDPIF
jgi:hypothetical protein